MITPEVQVMRQKTCRACEFWHGKCAKHHFITSAAACPIGRFPALGPQDHAQTATITSGCAQKDCYGAADKQTTELTYEQAVGHFKQSMVLWKASGYALATQVEYARRMAACGKCPHYEWFQCEKCKCLMFAKAKLATTVCPIGRF